MPLVLIKVNAYNNRENSPLSSSALELFINKYWKGRGRTRLKDIRILQNLPVVLSQLWSSETGKVRFSFTYYMLGFLKLLHFPLPSSLSPSFPLPSLHSKPTVKYGFKNAQPIFQSCNQFMVCFLSTGYLGNWVTNMETNCEVRGQ